MGIEVLTGFIYSLIVYNIPLLYGTVGEIFNEKSGSLNLGVEGTMAVGAMFGYAGQTVCFSAYSPRWCLPDCAALSLRFSRFRFKRIKMSRD